MNRNLPPSLLRQQMIRDAQKRASEAVRSPPGDLPRPEPSKACCGCTSGGGPVDGRCRYPACQAA